MDNLIFSKDYNIILHLNAIMRTARDVIYISKVNLIL